MDKQYKLIIFDMDGTLADRDTGELLPGVADWFNVYKHVTGGVKLAIATNQGGVGLRHWMESGGFGEPQKYPTEDDVWNRIYNVVSQLSISQVQIPAYVCFAYKSQKGTWSPTPTGKEISYHWQATNRKPNNGMLVKAMVEADILEIDTLMVGDSEEDESAALYAGCDFMWAWEFFKREKPE